MILLVHLEMLGEMLDVFEWDTGKFLGQIKQVSQTYAVVGNMNEHQVAIGETTFDGRPELENPEGGLHYWTLMRVTLQRARTAREAIEVMTRLVDEFEYTGTAKILVRNLKQVHFCRRRLPDAPLYWRTDVGRADEVSGTDTWAPPS